MAGRSPEGQARRRLREAVNVLRAGLGDRTFDISYHEALANAERSLEWLDDMKYMKSSYINLCPDDIDQLVLAA